jgi:DNA-directed RNA polymerase specialized sigma subunit
VCTIKQPTLYDEMMSIKELAASIGANMDVITETLIIEKFHQDPEEGDTIIYKDKGDIIDAYMSLPARDKRVIHKRYRDELGQYGIALKMRSNCIHCGAEEDIDLDLVSNFFRMVFTF